ncbi:hypothetical protein IMZ31_22200 (plasmid) [Pontibacillus sp. ALD_SL1]|uniref:hypothetical protein n=1 Tax=Pontibacillus sp. ALD_SL1 TaxID=2777185 RepID=UPI001A96DC36|nr:hypothetical protein [Pontibacillus sp. ALD_SL1]QST02167.1 hypothetical protein IMZ31_22200 [Pontibacillus sp. ALD_SL1]
MIIEVSIVEEETQEDHEFQVHVWDVEEQENAEELERTFFSSKEASDYVDSLVQDKKYVVYHV